MKSFSRLVFMLLVLVLVGGAIFLATWDIPPPIERVEKVLPDDRFPPLKPYVDSSLGVDGWWC